MDAPQDVSSLYTPDLPDWDAIYYITCDLRMVMDSIIETDDFHLNMRYKLAKVIASMRDEKKFFEKLGEGL
ncbi:MAG: hypothetical protein ACTSUE_02860 [Promethearchaeota archaeon]